jgi:hypothetical protein
MLTSRGKSAGLLNSDKRADNTPPVASAFKGNLLQITDGKNNAKQLLTDFLYVNKKERNLTIAAIVIGSFLVIQWIINKERIINEESDNEQLEKKEPSKNLMPLPELSHNYYVNFLQWNCLAGIMLVTFLI